MAKVSEKEYETLKGLEKQWKWIARDETQHTYAYKYRPIKSKLRGQWESNRNDYYLLPHDWLQFIQWSDSEPHNIAELIEEYERYEIGNTLEESEETEVKKEIEWAIKEIEGLETEPSQNYPHDEMIEREIVLGILSQLVPKQEEVDRAYKAGYETGKEHATRDDEPETVASVMADYFGAAARLKEVLAMEVEEMENDDN